MVCFPVSARNKAVLQAKQKGYDDSLLQASTQVLTLVDPGDFVKIKGWDGHSIDGSPSQGKGQTSGRVDVPVGATKLATSFSYVDATPLHRSPQSLGENRVCEGSGGEDKGAQGCGLNANLGNFG